MMRNLFSLENKTILITGGSGHLGSAMSEGLAKHGATVIIASKSKEKNCAFAAQLTEKYQTTCFGEYIDISNLESVNTCISSTIKAFGKIDVLVNNGYYGSSGKIEEMSEEIWKKGIDGSINTVFNCVHAILPHMMKQQSGNIINIASMYGTVSPDPSIYGDSGFNNPANYGAGKAAVIQFTKYLACHYGNKGIRANTISPGPFPSKTVQKNDEFIMNLSKKIPLGRIGSPSDLEGPIVFLASDASSYMTGQNIVVDGGWTAW